MSKTQNPTGLSATQREVLAHAIDNTEGKIEWFPATVKGGARSKILESLKSRGLASPRGQTWRVTKGAHAALGRVTAEGAEVPTPTPRENSKQATVIAMLKRPEGATIKQIMKAMGWQSHTVRGMISGALRKKLKLNVQCDKPEDGGDNVYRIA